jgi:monovalent cation:proton antiporter-2 (CPA2) family protein
MASELFTQGLVYLGASLIAVPLAKKLGLGSVLGYLLAGVAIGPFGLSLVGDAEDVMHFAEFGVVMMLFLVGLELEPERLWRMRGPILGLGGAQVVGSALVLAIPALLLGQSWQAAVALGLILAMSSTAIALQSLAEKGQLQSDGGRQSFAILLFQDISVIPLLALFPLLATIPVETMEAAGEPQSAWMQAGMTLGAILLVVGGGRLLVPPMMRAVAATRLRELFTAAALALVIAVTILMGVVGLSPALGTFLAGVVLANSEYRHELESDLEPWKGLLLGLFFMAVGATIDLKAIAESPLQTGLLVVGVMLCKAGVLLGLQRMNKNTLPTSILVTAAVCQVGEFAFVLLTFARSIGVLSSETAATGVVVTALSMALSPLVLVGSERLGPLLGKKEPERESDVVDEHNPVLIAGFGRFGQIAGRLLRSHGVKVTILDVDSDQIELMARLGNKVYYGDASRLDLLESAKAGEAKLLIVAVDEHEKAREIVRLAKKHFPALKILCRARGRTEAYELLELGVEQIYRETFDSSLRLGEDALQLLGFHPYQARRAVQFFRKHDEASVRELAKHRHDLNTLVQSARERVAALEEVLKQDAAEAKQLEDHGWDVKLKP